VPGPQESARGGQREVRFSGRTITLTSTISGGRARRITFNKNCYVRRTRRPHQAGRFRRCHRAKFYGRRTEVRWATTRDELLGSRWQCVCSMKLQNDLSHDNARRVAHSNGMARLRPVFTPRPVSQRNGDRAVRRRRAMPDARHLIAQCPRKDAPSVACRTGRRRDASRYGTF
jgi:hypothetical protein